MAVHNVSATGTSVFIKASTSFPVGFLIEGLADDADPIAPDEATVAEASVNINGELVVFGKPILAALKLAVLPDSPGDNNLSRLLMAASSGVRDVIQLTVSYPSGKSHTYSDGAILSGTPGHAITSAGRISTRVYGFAFAKVS